MGRVGWKDFIVWQCSIRQRNFRLYKGKPSEGLVCNLYEKKNNVEIKKFISVLLEKEVEDSSRMFEFMYKKTHDPEDRYLKAVKLFCADKIKIECKSSTVDYVIDGLTAVTSSTNLPTAKMAPIFNAHKSGSSTQIRYVECYNT